MGIRIPSVFVSHGSPAMLLGESPVGAFLEGFGDALPPVRAVLCVSAHWETMVPTLATTPNPETIHDFHGFPDALYRVRYPAPGAPQIAARACRLIHDAGLECAVSETRGLDHGAWASLKLMYASTHVPVSQCSIQHERGPAGAYALGRALAPLRAEGVLVLASGGAVHNLRFFRPGADDVPDWARRFDDWLRQMLEAGDVDALLDYRARAPDAQAAHPRDEHLLPLFAALGAGGAGAKARALHRGFMDGALGMAAFAFD